MMPYLIAGGVLALVVVIALVLRGGGSPSVLMFQQIREAILSLQAMAATQIVKATDDGKVQGMSQAEMERQTQRVQETIRFVYTIEEDHGHFIHTVSSQLLARKPEKYQVQCMLVVMLTLNQQLEAVGIDPKTVQFDVSRSEMGTHYVAMALSPEHNAKVLAIPKVA
jgi:hypothetical protein